MMREVRVDAVDERGDRRLHFDDEEARKSGADRQRLALAEIRGSIRPAFRKPPLPSSLPRRAVCRAGCPPHVAVAAKEVGPRGAADEWRWARRRFMSKAYLCGAAVQVAMRGVAWDCERVALWALATSEASPAGPIPKPITAPLLSGESAPVEQYTECGALQGEHALIRNPGVQPPSSNCRVATERLAKALMGLSIKGLSSNTPASSVGGSLR